MAWHRLRPSLVILPATLLLGACDSKDQGPDIIEAEDTADQDSDGQDTDADTDDADTDDTDTDTDDTDTDGSTPPPPPKPEASVLCESSGWGGYACTTDDGQDGKNYCILVDGEEFYTPCSTELPDCQPGYGEDYGCMGEICYWDGEAFQLYSWSEPECNTPLVVSFDGAPVEFSPASAAAFDLSPDGTCMSTDWPTAPWLALDRDGDGFIRDGGELFGSATAMSAGGHAEHGFAALAELDTNRDGKITAADERFGELVLWSDLDDDRIGAYAELRPLHETSVVAIDLGFERRASCDDRGNCGYERTTLEYRTPQGDLAVGEVIDVHVACR